MSIPKPTNAATEGRLCRVHGREDPTHVRTSPLHIEAHIDGSTISEDYGPDEMTDRQMFALWARVAGQNHRDGRVPIMWIVDGPLFCEMLPGQRPPFGPPTPHYLQFWEPPVDPETGEVVDWDELPMHIHPSGDFIERLTGWSPSLLQANVSLGMLKDRVAARRVAAKEAEVAQ